MRAAELNPHAESREPIECGGLELVLTSPSLQIPTAGAKRQHAQFQPSAYCFPSTAADIHGLRLTKPAWLLDMPPQEEEVSMFVISTNSVLGWLPGKLPSLARRILGVNDSENIVSTPQILPYKAVLTPRSIGVTKGVLRVRHVKGLELNVMGMLILESYASSLDSSAIEAHICLIDQF
jgi:hypothetical protein